MTAAKTYTLQSPTGELVTFTNLKAWMRVRGFNRALIRRMLQGKISHAYGWTLPGATPCMPRRKLQNIVLLSPSGELVEIPDVAQWCRQHGFSTGNIWSLITGRIPSAYGYRRPDDPAPVKHKPPTIKKAAEPKPVRPMELPPQRTTIAVEAFAGDISRALLAFAIDDRYACSMARAATLLLAGRRWQATRQGLT